MTTNGTPHFRMAWRAFKVHPRVFVASVLVLFASWAALEVAVIALHRLGVVFDVLLHMAFLVFFSGLMAGLLVMSLEVVREPLFTTGPRLGTLFASLDHSPQLLFALCLYLLGVAAGLLLFVVPGVYFAVRYALFPQALATRNESALESLRVAASLSQGRWWPMFGFFLKVLALNVIGAAFLGIGMLISVPVSLLAIASYYRTLDPPAPNRTR